MRVLYHHRTQGKAVEGVHIRGIADGLRREGVDVDIISLPGADPYKTPAAMSPTRQARPYMRLVSKLPQWLFELAELGYNAVIAWRVSLYLFRHRDLTFIYERYSLFMFMTVALARLARIPIILEVNDSASVERVRRLRLKPLALWLEKWTLRHADGLVFVSSRFHRHTREAHGWISPAIITPNAANIDDFAASPELRQAARARLGVESDVVCGYLGAFVPWHAIDQFVREVIPQLAKVPQLKLLLVGDGATYPEVSEVVRRNGLQDRVLLAGRVAHKEVPALLAAMDMAILPSAGDYTSPVKLFEFMAAGIAPVAPDLEPIREVLQEGVTGWLFPAYDMRAAVEQVCEKARSPEALLRVGQAAQAYVAEHRQWRNNVLQLLAFQRSLQTGGGVQIVADLKAKQRLYSADGGSVSLARVLLSDGTLANLLYRLQLACTRLRLGPLAYVVHLVNKFMNGCVIGVRARFGPGFVLIHPVGVVINSAVRGGSDVWIESGVVIGENRGAVPTLGDRVFVGSGAKIIGGVRVGNDCRIGANAVVLHDVPDGETWVGIPARSTRRS